MIIKGYREIYEIKAQVCNLANALHRNINDNFKSVSLDINKVGEIDVRIILSKKTHVEEQYIDDLDVEFDALQSSNNFKSLEVVLVGEKSPLPHIVYQVKGFDPKV